MKYLPRHNEVVLITNHDIFYDVTALFGYRAWEFSGMDLDEEEEDAGNEAEMLEGKMKNCLNF